MKKKRLIYLILIAVLILTVQAAGSQTDRDQPASELSADESDLDGEFSLESVQGCCVRVQVNGHHGSGIIYRITEDEIIVATNRHVLQYWDEDSYVTFCNGAVGNGRRTVLSESADVGFISIYTAFLTDGERKDLKAADRIKESPAEGMKIYMIDMASDLWNPVVYEGEVLSSQRYLEDFGMEMLYGEAASKAGMSGTGVFDSGGRLLGMLAGGTDANEIAAVPAAVLEEEYEKIY